MGWVERFGERWQLAEICRYKGELMARSQGSESAGQGDCYRKALEIARDQSSLAFELRAATSLARLWADQDNCEDAHDLLAPIYSRFGEGFQTSDLKATATLLATLSLDQEGRG